LNLIYNFINNNNLKELLNDTFNKLTNSYSCLNNNEKQIKNLYKCKNALYTETNDYDEKYECISCISGYSLDHDTKKCELTKEKNCEKENIIVGSEEMESCKKCYNDYDILVVAENGVKICETPFNSSNPRLFNKKTVPELEGCTEANVSTKYYYNEYNCTNCSYGYIPFYSSFYKAKICQYIYGEPESEKYFDSDSKLVKCMKGDCPKESSNVYSNNVFDIGNGIIFACNDEEVGMEGCKGKCTFSKNRIM
jgi:hypothetical protein